MQAPCRHPAGIQQAPGVGCRMPAGTGRHPAGTQQAPGIRDRVPAGTRQAPSRHPGSGACWVPAGTGRHPAGTRDGAPDACRHRQAARRKPERPSVQKAPKEARRCRRPRCVKQMKVAIGGQPKIVFKVLPKEEKLLSSSHGHCRAAVRKINESLTRGPAEHGLQSCTKRRKDPLLLSCYRRPLCVPQDAAVLRCPRKERARQR